MWDGNFSKWKEKYNCNRLQKDLSGRITNMKIQYKKQKIQIISLYAPDRPHLREFFFQNLKNYIFSDIPIIMGGGLQHGGMLE